MMNWHAKHKAGLNLVERAEEAIANFCGTRTFFMLHVVWFAYWILVHIEPFPYGLLTMIVSLEAILLSTIIMMNQRRQDKLAQAQAEHDRRIETEKLDAILEFLTPPTKKEVEDTVGVHALINKIWKEKKSGYAWIAGHFNPHWEFDDATKSAVRDCLQSKWDRTGCPMHARVHTGGSKLSDKMKIKRNAA